MELLIMALALCALGLLAVRFGHDSRARLRSSEEQAATWGMAWDAGDQC